MRFPSPLISATLIRRYKRFLADVTLDGVPDTEDMPVTAHVANPGKMTGLAEPGMRVWLERNDDPRRKLRYAWKLVDTGRTLVGVDTGLPNRLVRAALEAHQVPGLTGYTTVRREVPYGTNSRIDFLLEGPRNIYVEVKSVTLSRQPGLAEFPDTVTARGARHLDDLAQVLRDGHRAVLLYVIQRDDCKAYAVADDIDPGYARAHATARAAGIEVVALPCALTPEAVTLRASPLPQVR